MPRSGPGSVDRLAEDQHLAAGRRMLRPQAGDQPQDRALAAAAGPEHADELALVDQVLDHERHVADRRELVGLAGVVGLGDAAELDDVRQPRPPRAASRGSSTWPMPDGPDGGVGGRRPWQRASASGALMGLVCPELEWRGFRPSVGQDRVGTAGRQTRPLRSSQPCMHGPRPAWWSSPLPP